MNDAGFCIEANLLSVRECDEIITTLSPQLMSRGRAGSRHLMANEIVKLLATDNRLLTLARHYLGNAAIPFRATLFEKSRQANWLVVWHQDTALPLESKFDSSEWQSWSQKAGILYAHAPAWALARIIALRIHFDDSTGENGPLRIIPGSHLKGVLSDEEVFQIARAQESVECLVACGGVIAMRPLLIHASSKSLSKITSTAARRVLHIEYADSLELTPAIRLAIA